MKKIFSQALATLVFATACAACTVVSASPVLRFELAQFTSSKLDINVRMDDVSDLYAYQMSFKFDARTLGYRGSSVGPFLGTGGSTYFEPATLDAASGQVSYSFETLLGPVDGVSGSGILQTLSFDLLGGGSTSLGFVDAIALDSSLNNIVLQIQNSGFDVPEPNDLALVSVALMAGLFAGRRRTQAKAFSDHR